MTGPPGTDVEKEASGEKFSPPDQAVRYCGADCAGCDTHVRFLVGDSSGLVNEETGYRCCWLPSSYPEGRDCPIKACCTGRGFEICGMCERFPDCELLRPFYAQPGYGALRDRAAQVARERRQAHASAGSRPGTI